MKPSASRLGNRAVALIRAANRRTRARGAAVAAAYLRAGQRAGRAAQRRVLGNPRLTVEQARRFMALRRAADRRLRIAGPDDGFAARVTAAQRLARHHRKNPRKARTMAKRKRNRLGHFVKATRRRVRRARTRLGRFVAGAPVRRRKKSRRVARRRTKNPSQGALMSRALVANPRKKRRRARRAPSTTRRRRRSRHVASNPRRKRRHHRRHTRRNPSNSLVRAAVGSLLPMGLGGLGGAACGLVDAKFLSDKPVVSALSKVALGALGAAVLRKRPALAFGWAGGVMGSFGYSMGVKAAGGLVAHSPAGALKGIADMSQENPEMAALLEGLTADDGVGDVTDDMGDAGDYAEALQGSDDGDGVGDVIESD